MPSEGRVMSRLANVAFSCQRAQPTTAPDAQRGPLVSCYA
jgi:hypothetical protein